MYRRSRGNSFLSRFSHDLHLDLLDLQQPLPLVAEQVVDFFVEVPDFQFRLQVDQVIVLGTQTVLGLLPVLAHHDDGSLQGGDTGEDQVQQNKRIGVKRPVEEQHRIDQYPDKKHTSKENDEDPAAAECRHAVGEPLSQSQLPVEFDIDIAGEEFLLLQAGEDLQIQGGEFAFFFFHDVLHVDGPVMVEILPADKTGAVPGGVFLLDMFRDAVADHIRGNGIAQLFLLLTNNTLNQGSRVVGHRSELIKFERSVAEFPPRNQMEQLRRTIPSFR